MLTSGQLPARPEMPLPTMAVASGTASATFASFSTGTGAGAGAASTVVMASAEEGCGPDSKDTTSAEDAKKKAEEAQKAVDEAAKNVHVTQGDPKKFKDHFLRHKKLLEDTLGTKYPKLRDDGPRFLSDLQSMIRDGRLKYAGLGTLKKGEPEAAIYRGSGLTLVLRQDGSFQTLVKSGEGIDLGIQITKPAGK
jgi:hypothetical protein